MKPYDLESVVWFLNQDFDFGVNMVLDPYRSLWGDLDKDLFDSLYGQASRLINKDLLDSALVSQRLVAGKQTPPWLDSWIESRFNLEYITGQKSLEYLSEWRWTSVPVLLTGSRAQVVNFVIGAGKGPEKIVITPEMFAELMDRQCREGIEMAGSHCRSHTRHSGPFACWPLTDRKICGDSLGLAIYLGFRCAVEKRKFWFGIGATGRLDTLGYVKKVDRLRDKTVCARNNQIKALLISSQHARLRFEGIEIIRVKDLDSAWDAACMFEPGTSQILEILACAVHSPRILVSSLDHATACQIEYLLENCRYDTCRCKIAENSDLFSSLENSLRKALLGRKLSTAQAIARFVDASSLDGLLAKVPQEVFRWCLDNLSLANNLGDVEQADLWAKRAEKYLSHARNRDIGLAALYHNLLLVSSHNRFCFNPRVPASLSQVLDDLEGQFDSLHSMGVQLEKQLGRLYGTLAQNFGFCGPEYLGKTMEMCIKARQAFGNGALPEMQGEIRRLQNYLFYALLDAGRGNAARCWLVQYLETGDLPESSGQWERLDGWQQAAFARYLVSVQRACDRRTYLDWAWNNLGAIVGKEHPWQLWLVNLGRIALGCGLRRKAEKLFGYSLEICSAKGQGPTINVMALLPLAGMQALGLFGSNKSRYLQIAQETAEFLNSMHFKTLLKDGSAALSMVWHTPQKWFPFTYN